MVKPAAVSPLRFASRAASADEQSPGSQNTAQQHLFPLWLAIVFPKLLLEVFTHHQPQQSAVLIQDVKGQSVIYAATAAAEKAGINAGMALGAAYALCPDVTVYHYDVHVENNRLEQLALWATRFTPKLSIQSPNALLLEVRGSLKFFGGLKKLLAQISDDLNRQWQHQHCLAVTPTPAASLLLASSGTTAVVSRKEKLRSALGALPIRLLPLNEKQLKQLHNTGVRVLRDLWRLPKDALARRFGADLVRYLDSALGYFPDLRREFTVAESFAARREWPFEVTDTALIMLIAKELLEEMAQFLQSRDACISQCEFVFLHSRLPPAHVTLGVRQPTRDANHLLKLLKEHLERFTLAAPVTGLELSAIDLQRYMGRSDALLLFPNEPIRQSSVSVDTLLERLQIRLGREAIQSVSTRADHRPEYAYEFAERFMNQAAYQDRGTLCRPLWLLPTPQPLQKHQGRLWHHGPLSILQGPERIESGWWSGDDVRRDYYIAVDSKGSQLWIFRNLKSPQQWFLQGLFA
jgi:protein ImuB